MINDNSKLLRFAWMTLILTFAHGRTDKKIMRVAFIFSGSVRSFIYPGVHESIRNNLIVSFCPPTKCVSDIFVKASVTDNQHESGGHRKNLADSRGRIIKANEEELKLAQMAIRRLHVQDMHGNNGNHPGHLDVEWVDFSSYRELMEMETSFPSREHAIFRDLDYRRYSTNYHCWSNYHRAKQYEANNSITYRWFVKARFDMAFGHPVKPFSHWSANKVWMPDKAVLLLPDTFALLPDHFADSYFSMTKLIRQGVMCLGGPNMNKSTLEPTYLRSKGYSESDIRYVQDMKCEGTGFSETILLRKLEANGISYDAKTLDFASFFLVTIRKDTFTSFCEMMTYTCALLDILRGSRLSNAATSSGCRAFVQDLKSLTASKYSNCIAPQTSRPFFQYDGDTCPLNKRVSDWNYMPFRLRMLRKFGDGCLTVVRGTKEKGPLALAVQPCIEYENSTLRGDCRRVNATYTGSQVFTFFPLLRDMQPVRYFSQGGLPYCLTAGQEGDTNVTMAMCSPNSSAQSFMLDLVGRRWSEDGSLVGVVTDRHKAANKPILRDREFVRVRHRTSGREGVGGTNIILRYSIDSGSTGHQRVGWYHPNMDRVFAQTNTSFSLASHDVFVAERCRL